MHYFWKRRSCSIVVHTYNPSTQEAEVGGSPVPGQPGLHRQQDTVTENTTRTESRRSSKGVRAGWLRIDSIKNGVRRAALSKNENVATC
jgi:hypothetical protein